LYSCNIIVIRDAPIIGIGRLLRRYRQIVVYTLFRLFCLCFVCIFVFSAVCCATKNECNAYVCTLDSAACRDSSYTCDKTKSTTYTGSKSGNDVIL